MSTDLDKFYDLVRDIDVAMLVTRQADGHLRSRAMATQRRADGADLWFVARDDSAKLRDIEQDPHINLSYYNPTSREWISVSGIATLSRDRAKVRELYAADWNVWFPDEGDARHGTPDDPRMVLIGVTIHAAEFLEVNKSRPVLLYEFVKGWVTGSEPELGQVHTITSDQARGASGGR